METQATEPSQPPHHQPEYEISSPIKTKPKPKFNKYIAAIIILAIIVALFFYFKPAAQEKQLEIPEENETGALPEVTELPEEIPLGEFLNVSIIDVVLPTSTAIGSPFSAAFTINNTGNVTIDNAITYAKIDNVAVYTKQFTNLIVNKSETFGFTFLPADEFYPAVGEHTLEILVNGHSMKTKDFEVVERIIAPDLEIRSMSTTPVTNIKTGDNVTLTAYVRNVGSLDAINATVKFFVNGNLLEEMPADIAQQITLPFKTGWVPTEAGNYTLKVAAYASGDVYTDNNEYAMNVTVGNSTG